MDLMTQLGELLMESAPELAHLDPGIYRDLTMPEYLALPYVNAGMLEKLRRSALQCRHSMNEPPRTSPALERGTALHLAVLEPALFHGHYVVLGQCEGVKKDKDRCNYQASVVRHSVAYCQRHDPLRGAPGDEVEVLSQSDMDAVLGMRNAVNAHPRARSLFVGRGEFETTIIFDDPVTGVRCKIRPDRLIERTGMYVALKTTRDAAPFSFPRDAENRGYWRGFALYRRGLLAVEWPYQATTVLAIESTAPHDLVCYLTDEGDIESADREVTRLLEQYQECQRSGVWEGYSNEFAYLARPEWAKDK